ncbi:hypothetical protein M9H77_03233 [Catharanthus roseus]|uniref:Uncharacterized protein n=1 Tax=Catharanthus roseus TaxID=4058 RepID=A0ACC0CAU2_CATRO|nr:hypothetical protein M9H77_03233 [Catharanthus roseus]
MTIVAGGMICGCFYEAGSEATDLIAEKSWSLSYFSIRVEDVVSRVSATFDEHMRRLFEHNHLAYTSFPPMMPLTKSAMGVDNSTSSSTAVVAGTSKVPTRDSSTPPFSPLLFMLLDPPLIYPTPQIVFLHPLELLYRPPNYIYT